MVLRVDCNPHPLNEQGCNSRQMPLAAIGGYSGGYGGYWRLWQPWVSRGCKTQVHEKYEFSFIKVFSSL